ncbi:MAG: hypothetical protein OQJ81_00835, partial [Melioribacteraceae bacterium]|nr:hypothetical protein [Melioribacteraceae bacterium]
MKFLQENRSRILVLSILFSSFFFQSCNTNLKIPFENISVEKIKKRGKLIAITGFNAYSYFIYKGKTMGY